MIGDRLLLDTHTLIWWAEDNPRLPPATDARIRHADLALVSIASAWEIAIKKRLGKLKAPDEGGETLGADARHVAHGADVERGMRAHGEAAAFEEGRHAEAMIRFQRALELNPDDEDSKYNLMICRICLELIAATASLTSEILAPEGSCVRSPPRISFAVARIFRRGPRRLATGSEAGPKDPE